MPGIMSRFSQLDNILKLLTEHTNLQTKWESFGRGRKWTGVRWDDTGAQAHRGGKSEATLWKLFRTATRPWMCTLDYTKGCKHWVLHHVKVSLSRLHQLLCHSSSSSAAAFTAALRWTTLNQPWILLSVFLSEHDSFLWLIQWHS